MWTFLITLVVLYMFLSNKIRTEMGGTGGFMPVSKMMKEHFSSNAGAGAVDSSIPYAAGEYAMPWDKIYGKGAQLGQILYSTSSDYNPQPAPKMGHAKGNMTLPI